MPSWAEAVLRLTGGIGTDLVYIAGSGTIKGSVKAMRQGGVATVVGMLTQAKD